MAEKQKRLVSRDAQSIGVRSDDVDWLLNCSEASHGFRGTFASFLNAMERASTSAGGLPNTDIYSESIRWEVPRARKLKPVWHGTPPLPQVLLMAQYWSREVLRKLFPENIVARIEGDFGEHEQEIMGIAIFWLWKRGDRDKIESLYASGKRVSLSKYKRIGARLSRLAHYEWRKSKSKHSSAAKAIREAMANGG